MGQATVDLPESSAQSPAPSSSADDLLSQLAGEEIDRLLAEAEAANPKAAGEQSAPAQPVAAAESAPPPTEGLGKTDAAVVKVFSADGEVKQAIGPAAPQAAPSPAPAPQADQAAVDAILAAELAKDQPASPAKIESQPEETATSTAERSALDGVAAVLEAQARADEACPAPPAPADLPIYLKPLQWLSAPLSLFPETVRETIGKLAILTLFNAIAVMIYVLIFRRAH